MSDTDLSPSWHRLARRLVGADGTGVFPGRHSSRAEIAAETPIFHDLTASRTSAVRREPASVTRIPNPRTDPLSEFRRDPLSAPIPAQAYADVPAPGVSDVPQPRPAQSRSTQPRRRSAESGGAVLPAVTLLATAGAHALPEPSPGGRHHRPVPVSQLVRRG